MADHKSIILIPARFGSSRFPGKPLAKLKGKPLIQWVYQNMKESQIPTYVVTDSDEIEKCVTEFGGQVIRVNDEVISGSDRICLAYQRYLKDKNVELIINVQGDEPLLKAQNVLKLRDFHLSSSFDLATLVRSRKVEEQEFYSPHVVKSLYSRVTGQCLYFSRNSLPYGKEAVEWFQHIGVYSYKVQALERFVGHGPTNFEKSEKLEQLRALEIGLTIGATLIENRLAGVDTPEDLIKVEGVLKDDEK